LSEAVQSVLKQRFQDFEIIVVDNFSTDQTPAVMKRFEEDPRIHYYRNEKNMERGYSRNVGFINGKGEFLTLLDSDDLMYPDCLQDAYDFVQQNRELKVFHNLYEMINQEGQPSSKISFPPIKNQHKQICKGNFLSCIGVFLNKEIYKKFHFSEDLKMIGSEDYEIWFRTLAHYNVGRIHKINCGVREHLGRSVYSSMYENLEYQRIKLLSMIHTDKLLAVKYQPYLGYINANYFYHEAMYSLYKGKRKEALIEFVRAITKGEGFVFSRRFFGFIKNFLFNRKR
jgi:glycosyltransferase involved in cell wall biosynthesis